MVTPAELYAQVSKQLPFPTPEIIRLEQNAILMEYIPGMGIKQYLTYANKSDIDKLISFLIDYIDYVLANSYNYDFTEQVTIKHLDLKQYVDIDHHIAVMPKQLSRGPIHGDFTLENIIFYRGRFYFIDMHWTELNSVYFDANKLRQDLNGFWFVREDSKINYVSACEMIYSTLKQKFGNLFNDSIYAFMLARILPYCKRDLEKNLVLSEIKKCML
jgi:tRNA A-37 threonylcarbamoyl transferase component Bud32